MNKPIVSPKYDVIQYNGNIYNVPTSLNLKTNLRSQPEILRRRMEISSELGLHFHDKEGLYWCTDCSHTLIYALAMKQNFVICNNPASMCAYNPDETVPQWLSYFHKSEEKRVGLAARRNPCVADVGLIQSLVEFGKLDAYLTNSRGLQIIDFPYIKEVESDPKIEAEAIMMYQDRFKGDSPSLVSRIRNVFGIGCLSSK